MKTPAFLEPRLRLFLSADIVGSTALKQARSGGGQRAFEESATGPAWFSTIQGFYIEINQTFLLEWDKERSGSKEPDTLYGPDPEFWKSIGDEVLFVKQLTDHRQLSTTLQSWFAAIERIREFLKLENQSLDVKCTAWLAGFPFRNREVVIGRSFDPKAERVENYYKASGDLLNRYYRRKRDNSVAIDYIGPSIDTGFRLTQFASARKMIVSVDIAYALSVTNSDEEVKRIDLYYDGSASLKGVFGGATYPIFWIDMSPPDSIHRHEDRLKSHQTCNKENVKDYCDAFYKEHSNFTFRPFIKGDPGQALSRCPPWYDAYHAALVKNFTAADMDYAAGNSNAASAAEEAADSETVRSLLDTLGSQLKRAKPNEG